MTKEIGDLYHPEKTALLAQGNSASERRLERLQHRVDSVRKSYEKTLAALTKLRAAKPVGPQGPPAAPHAPTPAGDLSEQTQSGPQLVEAVEPADTVASGRGAGAPAEFTCLSFRRSGAPAFRSPAQFW